MKEMIKKISAIIWELDVIGVNGITTELPSGKTWTWPDDEYDWEAEQLATILEERPVRSEDVQELFDDWLIERYPHLDWQGTADKVNALSE